MQPLTAVLPKRGDGQDGLAPPPFNPYAAKLAAIGKRRAERALSAPTPAQLPCWPDSTRGIPNAILRTALFGAGKRGKRRYLEREAIAAVEGICMLYTGLRLDQADFDVWGGALHLARLQPLGHPINFTEREFLRMIGRGGENGKNIGKNDRLWLRRALARLSANTVEIQHGPRIYCGSLVDEYFRDENTGRYFLTLNPRMAAIFGNDGWTQIDWTIRNMLRGYPLAQWLQGFYVTHARPFPLRIETLHRLCGSEAGADAKSEAERTKALQGWRDDSLIPALDALVEACEKRGQSFGWELNGNLVNVSRSPSSAQLRHLQRRSAAKKGGGWDRKIGG